MRILFMLFVLTICLYSEKQLIILKDSSKIIGEITSYPEFVVVSQNKNHMVIPKNYLKSSIKYNDPQVTQEIEDEILKNLSKNRYSFIKKNLKDEYYKCLIFEISKSIEKDKLKYQQSIGLTNTVEYSVSFYENVCKATIKAKSPYIILMLNEIKKHPDVMVFRNCLNLLRNSYQQAHIFFLFSLIRQKQSIITTYNILQKINQKKSVGSILLKYFNTNINIQDEDAGLIILLGKIKYKRAVSILHRYSKSSNRAISLAAIDSLGILATSDAISKLYSLTENKDLVYKRKAIYALGKTQNAKVIPKLISFLDDSSDLVRESSHWALRNVTGQKYPLQKALWESWWVRNKENAYAISELTSNLYSVSEENIVSTLQELAKYRDINTLHIVEDLMFHRSAKIRRQACLYLEKLNYREFFGVLISLFEQEPEEINKRLIHTILKRQSKIQLEQDPYLWKKWWEAQPLHYNDSEEGLLELLETGEGDLLDAAIQQLGNIKSRKAAAPLRALMQKYKLTIELQKKIIKTLRKIRDWESIPLLIELLNEKDKNLQILSYSTLLTITKQDFENDYNTWYHWYREK
ncbi:HEAT repeat domain-containing protein [Candidatus Uabimicrobium sp. HlEnr_7]|uniref:HEAT repeat domain-containing protein n=1 Tax=Candidatus Uabimicrobium helgolandensis TaxID=3095367 RepID=UPI003557A761